MPAADAPTTPTLVMGDDGTMYTAPAPPPPETIYTGTVKSFGESNTGTYGFIQRGAPARTHTNAP